MNMKSIAPLAAALSASLLLAGCGGGSGGDVTAGTPPPAPVVTLSDPNSFLIFPNPQKQADGEIQTTNVEYATAYYGDIDPLNERDTAAKYRAKNGFDSGTGEQVTVICSPVPLSNPFFALYFAAVSRSFSGSMSR